jgi:hypothetical protein
MSTNIPSKLKAADITRFATRAAQLERVKPLISYWCALNIQSPADDSDTQLTPFHRQLLGRKPDTVKEPPHFGRGMHEIYVGTHG